MSWPAAPCAAPKHFPRARGAANAAAAGCCFSKSHSGPWRWTPSCPRTMSGSDDCSTTLQGQRHPAAAQIRNGKVPAPSERRISRGVPGVDGWRDQTHVEDRSLRAPWNGCMTSDAAHADLCGLCLSLAPASNNRRASARAMPRLDTAARRNRANTTTEMGCGNVR